MSSSSGRLTGERRHLSLLFCDLVGSTALSLTMDPEDFAEVVHAYQESVAKVIRERGGSIADFAGDGVLGQFGYPVAHEDDAERAVEAGLAVLDAVHGVRPLAGGKAGAALQCRVAVHSGLAVVSVGGDRGRGEVTVYGDAPNVASRVESCAEPQTVVVTDDTAALLRSRYDLGDERTLDVKGVDKPVRVHTVLRRASSIDPDPTGLVGRSVHLEAMRAAWMAVDRDHQGRSITLAGPAGVGKTTLVGALRGSVGIGDDRCFVHRSSALDVSSPFRIVHALVERVAGSRDGAEVARRLTGLLGAAAAAEVGGLIDVAADSQSASAEARHRIVIDAGAQLLTHVFSGSPPGLLVLDDLHWLDESSLAVVSRFVAGIDDCAVLVVATTRSNGETQRTLGSVVDVGPLGEDDCRRLLDALLKDRRVPRAWADAVVSRAAGIPLFVEELARAAADTSARLVPSSLRGAVLGRLDALSTSRRVIEVLSVFGRPTDRRLVHEVCGLGQEEVDGCLAELVEAGFVDLDGPLAGFRHDLVCDVVYESALNRARLEIHARVGEVLVERRSEFEIAMDAVGYHLRLGGRGAEAAEWYRQAAVAAARRGAFSDATRLCRDGLSGLDEAGADGALALALLITLGNALMAAEGYGAEACLPVWQQATRLAQDVGDLEGVTSAMNGEAVYWFSNAQCRKAADIAAQIVHIGETAQDRVAELRGRCTLALSSLYLGEPSAVITHARRAVSLYRAGDFRDVTYGFGTDQAVIAHTSAAAAARIVGERDHMRHHLAEAARIASEIGSPISICLAATMAAAIGLFDADAEAADRAARICGETAAKHELVFYQALSNLLGAGARAVAGDRSAADDAAAALLALAEAGSSSGASLGWWVLARSLAVADRHAEVLEVVDAALDQARSTGEHFLDAELLMLRAAAETSIDGSRRRARASLMRGMDVAEERGMTGTVAAIQHELAKIASG